MEEIFFILFGGAVGTWGTIIGAGGGFLLMPLLLIWLRLPHELAVGTSLTAVFCSVVVGAWAYWRQGVVDLRTGLYLGLVAIPGLWLGAALIPVVDPGAIRWIFAAVLAGFAWRSLQPGVSSPVADASSHTLRKLTARDGREFQWVFSLPRLLVVGLVTGVVSGFLGIGGGVVLVPVMTTWFFFPPQVAVATSLFALLFSSSFGAALFWVKGEVLVREAVLFGVGMVVGAQVGPMIARRAGGKWIMRALAAGLIVIAIRLVWRG